MYFHFSAVNLYVLVETRRSKKTQKNTNISAVFIRLVKQFDSCLCPQEFVAVRVQDPRVQSEGSWNSYVDYKIFLHVSIRTKELQDEWFN